MPHLKGRHLGIDGKLLDPDVRVRWEGEKSGFLARLYSQELRLDFDLPPNFRHLAPEKKKNLLNQALLDIDYYLHAETRADKLDTEELIDSWLRLIRKEIGGVFHVH